MSARAPLWSERNGGSLSLTRAGFRTLFCQLIEDCTEEGLFHEQFNLGDDFLSYRRREADEFFTYRLGDPWGAETLESPRLAAVDRDNAFDFLELLCRDVVSAPTSPPDGPVSYDRTKGQERFREKLNPILARLDPPLELDQGGAIVQRIEEPMRHLVAQPLPTNSPKREVADRVKDAVAHYRRRDASAGDRRAAVRELADVLEYLRPQAKTHLLTEDERDLFRLANEFAIRHNKPNTRRNFDEPVWLAWLFYVYLATIRLLLELER